jgi:hypothetical protein
MLPLIIGGLEAAAEAAPLIGRFAMQALPYAAAAFGAAPELKKGNIPGAVLQGGLGYLTGGAVKGGLAMAGSKLAPFAGSSITAAEAAQGIPGLGRLIPEGASLAEKARLGSKITQAAKFGAAAVPVAATGLLAQQALAAQPAGGGRGPGGGQGGGGPINTALGGAGYYNEMQRQQQFMKDGLPAFTPQGEAAPDISGYAPGAFAQANPLGGTQGAINTAQQIQRNNMALANLQNNYINQTSETFRQRDLQRQAAMAGLKTQLGTQQGLILSGQQYGAELAKQALADTGALARTTFSY